MDSGFNQNQSEFGVLVLSVGFQVLSDGNGFLNQEVQVFWDFWGQTVRSQDSQDSVTSDNRGLRNTVSISQKNTNLGWGVTFSGVLDDLFDNDIWIRFEPRWSMSGVWFSGRRDTFALLILLVYKIKTNKNPKHFF